MPIVAANPHGAIFNVAQSVTLAANEVGVTIYYTLDGSDPTISSPVYSSPISISAEGTTVLKFLGIDSLNISDIERAEEYTIDTIAPVTTADPVGGNYFASQSVELTCDDLFATIFYTTNGTNPTVNSYVYTTPIIIPDNKTTTLKFFAKDKADNSESIKTQVYNIEIAKNNYIVTNVFVSNPYIYGSLSIKWDDMYNWRTTRIIGYNIYRADTEIGPYQKLNKDLIAITQYMDRTLDTQIIEEDVSDQFRRTVNIKNDVDDNFTSKDYDVTKWIEADPTEMLFQFNGLLFVDRVGLNSEAKLTSKFKLKGNFDIQIDFDLLDWQQANSQRSSSIFRVKYDDDNFIQVARERSQTVNVYSSTRYVNGNPDLPITISSIDDYGTYRITRTGNIINTYLFDRNTASFVLIQSFTSYIEDLYVEIVGHSSDVPTELRWTKFKVVHGNPVIVEPMNQLKEMYIQVKRPPIVDSSGTNKATDDIAEVSVLVNGKNATIKKVQGLEGLIELKQNAEYDEVLKRYIQPVVPDEHSTVLVTYKTKLQTTNVALRKKYFYKVTTVTSENETDLDLIKPEYLNSDKPSYIYEEAIRRNAWILDNGGERVLLFITKKAGETCPCTLRDVKQRTYKRPEQDCSICYGSGFVGGFFGPYPIIIANMISEQRITQTERGLHLAYQNETWTGPWPLLSQRDLIVRRNCDRCLLGPITPVEGPDGVIVQQHFSIEVLDTTDIRYKFPIQPLLNQTVQPGIDKQGITVPEISSPKEREELITDKGIDRIKRGRSLTFQEIHY